MLHEKNKLDDKINKKKLYNPFANDQDYYKVEEKLPIEIKSRIPHWVPSKNADIFEVRKVLTSENEQIRNFNRSVGVYKVKNEIVISKNIKEEESKKLNKRINRDIANDIITQEKIKNKNSRNYISENRYNILSKLNGTKNLNNWTFQMNNKKNSNQVLTESDLNISKQVVNNEYCYNPIHTDLNSLRNESAIFKTDRIKKLDFVGNSKETVSIRRDISAQEHKLNPIRERNKIPKSDNKSSSSVSKIEKSNEIVNKGDEINANNSVLITSLANNSSSQVDNFFRNKLKKEYKDKFDTNTLYELKEEKEDFERNKDICDSNKTENKSTNKLANSAAIYEPPISSSMRYSVREYINKTREVVLLRHSVEIKKETALKMEENYKNKIESVTDSIVSLRQAKELFEEDFILRFDRYVKFLRVQREKELNELNNILEKKSQLELEIQKLENRKGKSKEFVRLYREYRDFLICVKERTTILPKFFMENENFQNNNFVLIDHYDKNKNYILKKNSFGKLNNPNSDVELTGESEFNPDEERKKRISMQTEKTIKVRSNLLINLNSSQNNDVTIINFKNNLSAQTKTFKTSKLTNFIGSNNLKHSNTHVLNTNSNINTHTNSPSKIYSATSRMSLNKGNKMQSSKLILNPILTEGNGNNSNASNIINITYNNMNNSKGQIKIKNENFEIIDPNLISIDIALIQKFNNYISQPIYENSDDLNEDIKKLQLENINLLKKLTATASKVNILKQNTKKLVKENNNEINFLKIEVEQREATLKEYQETNKNLLEEKNMLIGHSYGYNFKHPKNLGLEDQNFHNGLQNSKKSLVKNKFNKAILYSKVNEIFNLILEIPINANVNKEMNLSLSLNNNYNSIQNNITTENKDAKKNFLNSLEVQNHSNNNKNLQIERNSNIMLMLKIIEKSTDFLLAKQESYFKDPKKKILLEKLRTDLEKERKVSKAIEARLKDERRREFLNQAIIERNSKPIILPKRKFWEKTKPVEKKTMNNSVITKREKSSGKDLILD